MYLRFQRNGSKIRALPKIDKVKLDPHLIGSEKLDTDLDQIQLYRDNPSSPHPYPRVKSMATDLYNDNPVPYAEKHG